jgi:hypothetical protein
VAQAKRPALVSVHDITRAILVLRGQRVLLDAELAGLYGVTTKALNQAVKRNAERFPEDFMFRLTRTETEALNRSQIVTGSQKHRDPRFELGSRNLRHRCEIVSCAEISGDSVAQQ